MRAFGGQPHLIPAGLWIENVVVQLPPDRSPQPVNKRKKVVAALHSSSCAGTSSIPYHNPQCPRVVHLLQTHFLAPHLARDRRGKNRQQRACGV